MLTGSLFIMRESTCYLKQLACCILIYYHAGNFSCYEHVKNFSVNLNVFINNDICHAEQNIILHFLRFSLNDNLVRRLDYFKN